MLDIFELAREEGEIIGIQKGEILGIQKGKTIGIIETAREMLMDALIEKFNIIPPRISEQIRKIQNQDSLKALFRQVFKCGDIREFEDVLSQV